VVDPGDAVRALGHEVAGPRRQATPPGIRPGLDHAPGAQADDRAVAACPELEVLHLPPAVGHRHQVLRAGLHPADRPAQGLRQGRDHDHLGIHAALGAEAAPHRRGQDAHLARLTAKGEGNGVAHAERCLGAGPHRQPAVGLGYGEGSVGLHGYGGHALVQDAPGHHHLGPGEGVVPVPGVVAELEHDVGSVRRKDKRRPRRQGGQRVDHRGQVLQVDLNRLGGIHRRRGVLGHDHRHGLANEAHPLARQAWAGQVRAGPLGGRQALGEGG
jgi:hypothetical protein